MSFEQIIGVVFGVVAFLSLVGGLVFAILAYKRRRQKHKDMELLLNDQEFDDKTHSADDLLAKNHTASERLN